MVRTYLRWPWLHFRSRFGLRATGSLEHCYAPSLKAHCAFCQNNQRPKQRMDPVFLSARGTYKCSGGTHSPCGTFTSVVIYAGRPGARTIRSLFDTSWRSLTGLCLGCRQVILNPEPSIVFWRNLGVRCEVLKRPHG